VASDAVVRAAALEERQHWVPDADVQLRGRDEPTVTWVRRA
jgi:adenylate cyclase